MSTASFARRAAFLVVVGVGVCNVGGTAPLHAQAATTTEVDPLGRTIQIGIRGSAEYLWEFTYESGMTVIHAEEIDAMGIAAIIEKAKKVVGDGPTYLSFDIRALL